MDTTDTIKVENEEYGDATASAISTRNSGCELDAQADDLRGNGNDEANSMDTGNSLESRHTDSQYNEGCDISINPNSVSKITDGLVHNILPSLEKAKVSLDEALKNQDVLIETVQQENAKFSDCNSLEHLVALMLEARVYYNKLMTVKKDMTMLSDRTSKLKRRAVRLQQQKQKEEQHMIQRREKELEREQQLVARVVKREETQE
ncbi:hypothetical protein SNE40_005789 [Patella caerulea]|uniref:BLOC-1 subunit 6 n=1 Tax=Patella caerulea TaxID=87958 RepID=A0AAN8Q539_PATCE